MGEQLNLTPAKQSAAPAVVEQVAITDTATEVADSTAVATAEGATESAAANTESAQTAQNEVKSSAEYEYYVVMGIFSTEENASRAVAQAESRIKDLSCKVLPFKDKYMVTLYGSDKITDCNAFANSYRDIYADLWVYKKK